MSDDAAAGESVQTVSVTNLKSLGAGVYSCQMTTPDNVTRTIVVPASIATLQGVMLSAGVISELAQRGAI